MSGLITDQVTQALTRMRETAPHAAASMPAVGGEGVSGGPVPEFLHAPMATAMSDSLMLPLALAAVGLVACLFFAKPVDSGAWASGQDAAKTRMDDAPARRGDLES